MNSAVFAGALALSFVLGGVTTLLGFPRYLQTPTAPVAATISPEELTRAAGPLPEQIVDSYF